DVLFGRRLGRRFTLGIAVALGGASTVSAQDPPAAPAPNPSAPAVPPAPGSEPLPAPAPPAVVPPGPAAAATTREAALEARILQLETMLNQLSGQVQQMSVAPARSAGVSTPTGTVPTTGADVGTPASTATPSASGGPAAPGQSLPPNPAPVARFDSPATLASIPGNFKFGPGFELRTRDEEFFFQFHNLTQFDYRGYQQGGQNPVRDTFTIPRQWFMFSGR